MGMLQEAFTGEALATFVRISTYWRPASAKMTRSLIRDAINHTYYF